MPQRLARPVYEALPLLWALAGGGSLAASYFLRAQGISGPLGLLGLALLVVALAVWMHRRDYRATSADYRLRGLGLPDPRRDDPPAP